MGPNDTTDIESLQKGDARRGRGLDFCLVLSVIVLFTGLVALAVAGVLVIHDLQSQLQHKRVQSVPPVPEAAHVVVDAPGKSLKMQSVYLGATSYELNNKTMTLDPQSERPLGSNFEFNPVRHTLSVKHGTYFLYMEVNVTCLSRCQSGVFTIRVSDKLSCEMKLPNSTDSQPIQRKCWTVTSLSKKTELLAQMTLPHGPLPHWRLELRGSGFGLFLVS
ncbi:uncharacterized protein LOC129456657 [Periophthalmus magnuspinnatus]|uniref:uncharacterized protein LOC129456657 n=1 Tax=Periophthalmus magnuspinnatus TaxID=409849 RepID=UPI002436FDF1|nr:uncharacterized protein LOC129456657 [Periophthalmus magnuspinnatus]